MKILFFTRSAVVFFFGFLLNFKILLFRVSSSFKSPNGLVVNALFGAYVSVCV